MRKRGSVTRLEDGRFWARAPRQADGSRPSLGMFETEEAAWRAIAIDVARLPGHAPDVGTMLPAFGEEVLDDRELNGVRGVDNERSNFRAHVAPYFANDTLASLDGDNGRVKIAAWLRAMTRKKRADGKGLLEKSTIMRVLSLLSAIFDEAGPQGRGLMKSNPCLGMKVKRKVGESATKEKWTFFTPGEREWFSLPRATSNGYVREHERLAILFGEGSGIRQGEQFNLGLDDMHEEGGCTCAGWEDRPHAVIRFGSKGLPRKNGKILIVALFGYALEAARTWRRRVASFAPYNPHGLVWPLPSGARRARGKPLGNGRYIACDRGTHKMVKEKPVRVAAGQGTHVFQDRWKAVQRIAGITRNVRWHDVRHSCASALIQGQLGEKWFPHEIKEQLGHSSLAVTERYTHLDTTSRKDAADKVRIPGRPNTSEWNASGPRSIDQETDVGTGSPQPMRGATDNSRSASTGRSEPTDSLGNSRTDERSRRGNKSSTDATIPDVADPNICTSARRSATCATATNATEALKERGTDAQSSTQREHETSSSPSGMGKTSVTSPIDSASHRGPSEISTEARSGLTSIEASGGELVSGNGGAGSSVAAVSSELSDLSGDSVSVEQRGIEPLTSALRTRSTLELLRALGSEKGHSNQLVTHLAATLTALLEKEPT